MKKKILLRLGTIILSLLVFAEHLGGVVCAVNTRYQTQLAIEIGIYITENNVTQTDVAAVFHVSKETVRNYIYRLQTLNPMLYQQVIEIIELHKHLGGVSIVDSENRSPLTNKAKRRRYLTKLEDQDVLAVEIGDYIVNNNATYMDVSAKFEISETKSRRYVKKLERIKPALYTQVKKIVEQHKHLGGITANLGGQRALIGRQKRTKFSYGTPEFYITQCDCEFL